MSNIKYVESSQFNCPCGTDKILKKDKQKIQCSLCGYFQHIECIKNANKMLRYICPICQLNQSDLFQKILYHLLPPSLYKYKPGKKIHTSYSFIPDFSFYKSFEKINNKDQVFIIFRSLRLEEKGFSFHWPINSKILINNKTVLNLQEQGPKTKLDRPIVFSFKNSIDKNEYQDKNIFPYDGIIFDVENYFKDIRVNRLEISIDNNSKRDIDHYSYVISVDFCEIIKDVEDVISSIQIINDIENLRSLLNKSINLSVLHEKVPLIDIYTKSEPIILPARGFDCMHLPVFDLPTFLIMNRRTKKYECPFCKRVANRLYIDGMILNFIKEEEKKDLDKQKKVLLLDFDYNKYEYENDIDDAIFNYNNGSDVNDNKNEVNNVNNGNKMEEEIDLN